MLTRWTATVSQTVSHAADDRTIRRNWLGLAETLPSLAFTNAVLTGLEYRNRYHPLGLALFATAMLAACLIQRFCRRQEIKRGVPNHSYFIGSSWFRTRKWHPWFYQHRRLEKFVDPIATVLIGLALLNISILPAIWILCSGFCLFVLETTIQRRDLHRQLDTLDGLVDSEAMSENVEHFSEAPTPSHNPQVEPGIPTGIGDDIREKVETNKKKNKKQQL